MKKLIFIVLLLLCTIQAGFSQWFSKGLSYDAISSIYGDTAKIFFSDRPRTGTSNYIFQGNITVYDTLFGGANTTADSLWKIINKSRFVYGLVPQIEKDTGGLKLVLKNKQRSSSASLITFETWDTQESGTDTTTGNSFLGMSGKSMYFINRTYGGLFIGGGGHDKYQAIFDTNNVVYWSAVNSVSVGGSITGFRDPLGTATNRRFMATSNDSVAGQSRNWNIINPFSNYVGLKLTGTQGITSTHWINQADSSRNFDGTLTRGINWRRDGKMLFKVDNDTNAMNWYDHTSANPITFMQMSVDSVDNALTGIKFMNRLTGEAAIYLQNTATGFGTGDGLRIRENVSASIVNQENSTLTLGANMLSNLVLNTDGSVSGIGNYLITWATNVDAGFQRGTVDTDLTRIKLRSNDGTAWYLTISDLGVVTTSTTAP